MDSKLRDLLEAALAKTHRNGLPWQKFDSESFRARFGRGYLHIQRSTVQPSDDEGNHALRFSVQVTDPFGQVLAEADTVEGRSDYAPILQQLFTAARTSALGGYEIIDSMLQELQVMP